MKLMAERCLAESGKLNLICVHGIKYIESCNLIHIFTFHVKCKCEYFYSACRCNVDLYVGESRC